MELAQSRGTSSSRDDAGISRAGANRPERTFAGMGTAYNVTSVSARQGTAKGSLDRAKGEPTDACTSAHVRRSMYSRTLAR
jgi:hypothetical protein